MNIRYRFKRQVYFCFFMLCHTSGLFAQPPVYKITKSVSTDARSRLFLLNENSDVAGVLESEIPSYFAPVRWGVEDTVPVLLGEIVNSSLSYDVKAMNDEKIIVGSEKKLANSQNSSSTRAVFWGANDTETTVLESLGPYTISNNFEIYIDNARAINNSNIIVGDSLLPENGSRNGTRATRWDSKGMNPVDLGVISLVENTGEGFSTALAINDSGIIMGESYLYGEDEVRTRAVRWGPNDTEPTLLGTLDDESSKAIAINANGVIIGNVDSRAVYWKPDTTEPTVLGVLSRNNFFFNDPNDFTFGFDNRSLARTMGWSSTNVINNSGVIAGRSASHSVRGSFPPDFSPLGKPAVRWDTSDKIPTDLSVLGTTAYVSSPPFLDSWPNDINDNNIIVGKSGYGVSVFGSDPTKAVLWDENGDLFDLNLLLDSSQQSEWFLGDAIAINNSGVILAKGKLNGDDYYAVLEPQGASTIESANKAPDPMYCDLGVEPYDTINAGEGVLLWWWALEDSLGSYPIINNGIGFLNNFSGYIWVYPSENTTYKMSARRRDNKIATCEITIVVENETEPTPALCDIGAVPQTIKAGERVGLWWWSWTKNSDLYTDVSSDMWAYDSTFFPSIDNGIGQIDFEGYDWFYPDETTTYTMKVTAQGTTATCETVVVVED